MNITKLFFFFFREYNCFDHTWWCWTSVTVRHQIRSRIWTCLFRNKELSVQQSLWILRKASHNNLWELITGPGKWSGMNVSLYEIWNTRLQLTSVKFCLFDRRLGEYFSWVRINQQGDPSLAPPEQDDNTYHEGEQQRARNDSLDYHIHPDVEYRKVERLKSYW